MCKQFAKKKKKRKKKKKKKDTKCMKEVFQDTLAFFFQNQIELLLTLISQKLK